LPLAQKHLPVSDVELSSASPQSDHCLDSTFMPKDGEHARAKKPPTGLESAMPKGQQRSNREKKKPKQPPKPVAPHVPGMPREPWKK
jgi:hypothetical protein